MRSGMQATPGLETAAAAAAALARALAARRVYGAEHFRFCDGVADLHAQLRICFREARELPLHVEGTFLLCGGRTLGVRGPLSQLAAALDRNGVRLLAFHDDVRPEALHDFLAWAHERGGTRPGGFPGISLLYDEGQENTLGEEFAAIPEFRAPLGVFRTAGLALDEMMASVRSRATPDASRIARAATGLADEARRSGLRLVGPTQMVGQDVFTYQHSVNVALVVTSLLEPVVGDRELLARIAQAALLHDVGKCRVPSEILNKQGPLTPEERTEVERHPGWGAEILLEWGADPLAIEAAYCHHMREEGHGYPQPRTGLRPSLVSVLIQVADVFEALTSRRPYKEPISVGEAVRLLLGMAGFRSRHGLVSLLARRLTETPPGSMVILDTGEAATVISPSEKDPSCPVVRMMDDDDPQAGDLVDLRGDERRIAQVLLKPGYFRF